MPVAVSTGNVAQEVFIRAGQAFEDFHISDTVNGLGTHLLIAAPGLGHRLIIRQIQVQNEASQTSITAVLLRGGIARWRIHMPYEGDGFCLDSTPGNHWVLPPNTAFSIYCSAAGQVGVNISYSVQVV